MKYIFLSPKVEKSPHKFIEPLQNGLFETYIKMKLGKKKENLISLFFYIFLEHGYKRYKSFKSNFGRILRITINQPLQKRNRPIFGL